MLGETQNEAFIASKCYSRPIELLIVWVNFDFTMGQGQSATNAVRIGAKEDAGEVLHNFPADLSGLGTGRFPKVACSSESSNLYGATIAGGVIQLEC